MLHWFFFTRKTRILCKLYVSSSTDALFFYGIWMAINIRNKTFTDLVEQFPH